MNEGRGIRKAGKERRWAKIKGEMENKWAETGRWKEGDQRVGSGGGDEKMRGQDRATCCLQQSQAFKVQTYVKSGF